MVTMKGRFKVETREKWHMLTFVDVAGLRIDISKWLRRWLEIMVEEEGRTKGWALQNREGDQMKIRDMYEVFQQVLSRVQLEEVGLIPEGVEVGEK